MNLLATSDWPAILTAATPILVAFFGAVGTILTIIIAAYLKLIESKATTAAVASTTAAIATDKLQTTISEATTNQEKAIASQEKKLEEMAVVADKTHALVNSAMTAQLRLVAKSARLLADHTKNPEHIKDAVEAEKLLAEHIEANKPHTDV